MLVLSNKSCVYIKRRSYGRSGFGRPYFLYAAVYVHSGLRQEVLLSGAGDTISKPAVYDERKQDAEVLTDKDFGICFRKRRLRFSPCVAERGQSDRDSEKRN